MMILRGFWRKGVSRVLSLMLAAGLLMLLAGCPSAMTETQLRQVSSFATAAEGYGPVPGDVLRFHGDLGWNIDWLDASTMSEGGRAAYMKQADGAKEIAYRQAKEADAAIGVLNEYARMLKTLAGPTYSDALGKGASKLGDNIDAGVKSFNALSGESVSEFGGLVAKGIQALGGLIIRHKQAAAIRLAVGKADKSVAKLLDHTMGLMKKQMGGANDFKAISRALEKSYVSVTVYWQSKGQPVPLETLDWSLRQNRLTAEGEALAKQAYAAAEKYKAAHVKLVESINKEDEWAGIMASVETFANEVESVLALWKKMKK